MPSVITTLHPDALAYAFSELLLQQLRWDTLTLRQYRAFEALFKQFHLQKGALRYAAAGAEGAGGGLWFLSKLWRSRKAMQERYTRRCSVTTQRVHTFLHTCRRTTRRRRGWWSRRSPPRCRCDHPHLRSLLSSHPPRSPPRCRACRSSG